MTELEPQTNQIQITDLKFTEKELIVIKTNKLDPVKHDYLIKAAEEMNERVKNSNEVSVDDVNNYDRIKRKVKLAELKYKYVKVGSMTWWIGAIHIIGGIALGLGSALDIEILTNLVREFTSAEKSTLFTIGAALITGRGAIKN